MCLAFPMRVIKKKGRLAQAKSGDIQQNIYLDLVEGVKKGDYVLVHAGFAIKKINEARAKEIFELVGKL